MDFPDECDKNRWNLLCEELTMYLLSDGILSPGFSESKAADVQEFFNIGTDQHPIYDYSRGNVIYGSLVLFLRLHMKTMYEEIRFLNGDLVLAQYVNHWKTYVQKIPDMVFIFGSLQDNWINVQLDAGKEDVFDVEMLCYGTAKTHFFRRIEPKLSWTLRDMIISEHYGEPLDTDLVKQTIDTYIMFGNGTVVDPGDVYKKYFEAKLLTDVKKCFTNLKHKCLPHHGRDMCAVHMSKQYRIEKEMVRRYMHPSTWPKLRLNFDDWEIEHNNVIKAGVVTAGTANDATVARTVPQSSEPANSEASTELSSDEEGAETSESSADTRL